MTGAQTVHFATGNSAKVHLLQTLLGSGYKVKQVDLVIHEIQHDDVEEIVREKARAAFQIIKKPLVTQDGGLFIEALKGFPGPYVRHIHDTIGPEGVLKLLQDIENRYCCWRSAIAYADENGDIHSFVNDPECRTASGTIATYMGTMDTKRAFSNLWKVFIPAWADKAGCYLSDEECDEMERQEIGKTEFGRFVSWFLGSNKK